MQDAQEFGSWLIAALHEATDCQPVKRIRGSYAAGVESSRISSLFSASMTSSLRCADCGRTSVTIGELLLLQLHLPSGKGKCDLVGLLREFVAEEILTADEIAKCDSCTQKSMSSKTPALTSAPPVLFVHLKRFHGNGRRRNNSVSFPLQGLVLPLAATAVSCSRAFKTKQFPSLRKMPICFM